MALSEEETSKLIDIWARAEVQVQLEGCHRNREVHEKVVKELLEEDCTIRTYGQCQRATTEKSKTNSSKPVKKDKTGNTSRLLTVFWVNSPASCH